MYFKCCFVSFIPEIYDVYIGVYILKMKKLRLRMVKNFVKDQLVGPYLVWLHG